MEKSENIDALTKALIGFWKVVPSIAAPATNTVPNKYTSYYAPLPLILEKIKKPLLNNGLVISQLLCGDALTTMLMHTSGQWLAGTYNLHPVRKEKGGGTTESLDPQTFGSVITYAKRYGICSILGLAPDGDDDGTAASEYQDDKPELVYAIANHAIKWDDVSEAQQKRMRGQFGDDFSFEEAQLNRIGCHELRKIRDGIDAKHAHLQQKKEDGNGTKTN